MGIKCENEYELLIEAYKSVKNRIPYEVDVGLILGSGLGDFVNKLNIDATISFDEIENFPKTTNIAHKGKFVFAKINGKKVVVAQGRVHYYEGYEMNLTMRIVRLMKMFGVSTLYITNAAGAINSNFRLGNVMLITNHISFFMPNPLIGKNIEEFGIRFPDMSEPYDKELQEKIIKASEKNNIDLVKGVYVQMQGPSFETLAEVNALRILGADAVGMSTVVEVIVARHAGIKVAAMSMITNLVAGLTTKEQSDDDVKESAIKYSEKLETLLIEVI